MMDLNELLPGLRDGDRSAWAMLYQQCGDSLMKAANKFAFGSDPEEVFQEAWADLMAKDFREVEYLSTGFLIVHVQLTASGLRKRGRTTFRLPVTEITPHPDGCRVVVPHHKLSPETPFELVRTNSVPPIDGRYGFSESLLRAKKKAVPRHQFLIVDANTIQLEIPIGEPGDAGTLKLRRRRALAEVDATTPMNHHNAEHKHSSVERSVHGETATLIEEFKSGLPALDRRIFELRAAELSFPEIAEIVLVEYPEDFKEYDSRKKCAERVRYLFNPIRKKLRDVLLSNGVERPN